MARNFSRLLGAAFWMLAIAALGVAIHRAPGSSRRLHSTQATRSDVHRGLQHEETLHGETDRVRSAAGGVSLWDYFSGPADVIEFSGLEMPLRTGDPVFVDLLEDLPVAPPRLSQNTQARSGSPSARQRWVQVGYVRGLRQDAAKTTASVVWFSRSIPPDGFRLIHYRATGRIGEVLATMFPPEKQTLIRRRITTAMSRHGNEMTDVFVPLVRRTLRDSIPVIERGIEDSLRRHRDRVDRLTSRFQRDVVAERLVPLAKREILPIVRRHAEEPVGKIGRDLWDRASIWRFGWRALYDQSPLPNKKLVREEWDRFVTEEATPVFESHLDEVVTAVQRTLADVAASGAVRQEFVAVAEDFAADPEARRLVQTVLREALVENVELRRTWQDVWTSRQAEVALDAAARRIEPVVRSIGDDLFGSREKGINPDFARVLRNQILGKDRSWIVARRDQSVSGVELSPRPGRPMPFPVVYLAGQPPTRPTPPDDLPHASPPPRRTVSPSPSQETGTEAGQAE